MKALDEKIIYCYGVDRLHVIKVEDIKEFIKKLKEELGLNPFDPLKNFVDATDKEIIIDKLAGEELK